MITKLVFSAIAAFVITAALLVYLVRRAEAEATRRVRRMRAPMYSGGHTRGSGDPVFHVEHARVRPEERRGVEEREV
jgi:hypothetical protein